MPTILHRLSAWADEAPDAPAQRYKEGGVWKTLTVRDYLDRVFHLALFLESRGFTKDHVGGILAYNSPEWVHMDLAPILLGGRSAGLYPNSSPKDIAYVLEHIDARVVSVQNGDYFKKLDGKLPPSTELIIIFDGNTSVSPKAVSYAQALREGRELAKGKNLRDYLDRLDPKSGAFLIYTSGTTGNPKGALLSHENLVFTSDVVMSSWRLKKGSRRIFSFLPLCHIAEKMQNIGVGISCRYAASFASSFDNVSTELAEVQPHLLLSVPRLWEKMVEGVQKKVNGGKGAKKQLGLWALDVGARVAEKKYSGQTPNLAERMQLRVADKLVLSKIRQALGLGEVEQAASGAAALPATVARWFRSIGVEILEDYGQTESTGVICMTEPGVDSLGTVGKAPSSIDFRIADDGEILTRGKHVFVGYLKNDAATAETVVDGWLHTGDLGELDDKGRVRIRGRKKEIMKSSGGKMVAPLPIEEKIKELPLISQACMVGDGRKYFSVLLTLTEKENPEVLQKVKDHLDSVNKTLAGYERIKYFKVLPSELSVERGEMTPTMKIKRNVVEDKYRELIDQMY